MKTASTCNYGSSQAFGETVTARVKGHDRWRRTLANVILPDGRNLNQEIVRAGFAWWFRRYSNDRTLENLEAEARTAKQGLWADPDPVPPWEWRRQHHNGAHPK